MQNELCYCCKHYFAAASKMTPAMGAVLGHAEKSQSCGGRFHVEMYHNFVKGEKPASFSGL